MKESFDAIVIGVGSMGSAACFELTRRGFRVLGLDRFPVPHENGSHTGQSRIIRKAYFEHPDYVPLLESAYRAWADFERLSGEKFYTETGLLYAGPDHSALIKGVQESAVRYGIAVEDLAPADRSRFSVFDIPADYRVLYEPQAGFLTPESAISAYVRCAGAMGARFLFGEKIIRWQQDGEGVTVETSAGSYRAARLVLAGGAWTSQLLPDLASRLKVTRQIIAWFHTRQPERFAPERFPCWLIDEQETGNVFYGFPQLDPSRFPGPQGLKVAQHDPGPVVDPERSDRHVSESETGILAQFMDRFMPDQRSDISALKSCLYTYSPDEHFIIDAVPGTDGRVVLAAGFSGHGFKFVPVIGEILADLALSGATGHPAAFLSLDREALRHSS